MYRHILVPIDGSPLAEAAADAALELAARLGARITLFHAMHTAEGFAFATVPPYVDRAQIDGRTLQEVHSLIAERTGSYLQRLVQQLQDAAGPVPVPVPVVVECVEEDVPHRGILEAARRLGCDLILMASHGRRGLQALLLGSETQKVLTQSSLPVLVWRPGPGPEGCRQRPSSILRPINTIADPKIRSSSRFGS